MLDGIPFGSAGGKVSNGHGEPKSVAELGLKSDFPGSGTATGATPVSARMSNCRARRQRSAPSRFHQPAMEWAAKAAVSPTKTEPRLASRS